MFYKNTELLEKIKRMRESGMTYEKIAKALMELKIPNAFGKIHWCKQGLQRYLTFHFGKIKTHSIKDAEQLVLELKKSGRTGKEIRSAVKKKYPLFCVSDMAIVAILKKNKVEKYVRFFGNDEEIFKIITEKFKEGVSCRETADLLNTLKIAKTKIKFKIHHILKIRKKLGLMKNKRREA